MDVRDLVLQEARRVGLTHVRFTAAQAPAPRADALERWIQAGLHGGLQWVADSAAERADPRRLLPSARGVVVVALEHHATRPPDPGGLTGKVAAYAWGRDYHNVLGRRVRRLEASLRRHGVACYGGVDARPLLERGWAEAAGLGVSGKNCLLLMPGRTSWLLLGVILLDAPVLPDPPAPSPTGDPCGRCDRCLVACPTQAFRGPRVLDAARCLSYWTIETRDALPVALRAAVGRWVFGCDVCQEVCPHNTAPPPAADDALAPRNAWLDLPELLQAPDRAVEERFRGTPLLRAGAVGLKRNACTVLGNLGRPAASPSLAIAADHPDPAVREHARWALTRLEAL